MKKKIPTFQTDEEAEEFVANADLTEYDLSGGTRVRFEFAPKDARLTMRLPESLMATLKDRAKTRGIPYQRYVRELLEEGLAREKAPRQRSRKRLVIG